jgi:hypothetical protein
MLGAGIFFVSLATALIFSVQPVLGAAAILVDMNLIFRVYRAARPASGTSHVGRKRLHGKK